MPQLPSFSKTTAALCLFLQPMAWAAREITFYTDGQCQNRIDARVKNYNIFEDSYSPGNVSSWEILDSAGLRADPPFNSREKYSFPGAEAPGGGYDVYFKFPHMEGCSNILMRDYMAPARNNRNIMGGAIIAWAQKDNCLFAHVPEGANLYNSFCCGTDCQQINMGISSLSLKKRDDSDNKVRRETSLTARAAKAIRESISPSTSMKRDDGPTCSTVDQMGNDVILANIAPEIKSAPQVALVNQVFNCQAEDCHIDRSYEVSTAMSVATAKSFNYQISEGLSVNLEVGTDFIVEAKVNTGFSFSATQAWEESTTREASRGLTHSTTVSLTSKQNQLQVLTFVPTVACHSTYLKCDGVVSEYDFEFCQAENQEQPEGEPIFVSIGTGW